MAPSVRPSSSVTRIGGKRREVEFFLVWYKLINVAKLMFTGGVGGGGGSILTLPLKYMNC